MFEPKFSASDTYTPHNSLPERARYDALAHRAMSAIPLAMCYDHTHRSCFQFDAV